MKWRFGPTVLAAAIPLVFAGEAAALDAAEARGKAQLSVRKVGSELGSIRAAMARAAQGRPSSEKRVAAGELLLRTGDYDAAITTLSKVVELHRQGKVPETSYADALFLLGEAYFQSEQYLSAQRHYHEIAEKGARAPYDFYVGRALSRLVDVALRSGHDEQLDFVFARLAALPQSDASGSLPYARGKALYARGSLSESRQALTAIPSTSKYSHQAAYLVGVLMMKQAIGEQAVPVAEPTTDPSAPPPAAAPVPAGAANRFAATIEQFRAVTRMPADTEEHRHVIDLAWMAIGRLFYESDNYLDAADAYSHVDRRSPEFSDMLFELAWVYVRLGDYQRAQRALEVLAIAAPETLQFADGSLLRADLMLRSGMFERALQLYESVRNQYDPMRDHVNVFLRETTDPTIYYDKLIQDDIEQGSGIDPTVLQWVREEAKEDRVFAVIDDVNRSRDLIRDSRRLALKLKAVLGSSTRAKAFPELKAGLERTLGLLNQVALARRTLALGLEDVDSSPYGGELGQVRAERRSLMKRMNWLPVTDGDFSAREASGERQWNGVSQQLQRLTLEADRLQAIVNGLRRVLQEGDEHGVSTDPSSRARFVAEVEANERDLATYRQRIKQFQDAVEMGRAQIGFGDQRYIDDDRIRMRFAQLLGREAQLLAAGQGGGDARAYAASIQPVLSQAAEVDNRLLATRADLDARVRQGSEVLWSEVDLESRNIEEYAVSLDTLDQNSRLLVGEVAMRNFALVRDRLKSIVLRADVGIVQQAWEMREEQRSRVRTLQRERSREEQNLNDELREVLDDAGETL